jgi:hypothetical protein
MDHTLRNIGLDHPELEKCVIKCNTSFPLPKFTGLIFEGKDFVLFLCAMPGSTQNSTRDKEARLSAPQTLNPAIHLSTAQHRLRPKKTPAGLTPVKLRLACPFTIWAKFGEIRQASSEEG